jgi:hypothetical protein
MTVPGLPEEFAALGPFVEEYAKLEQRMLALESAIRCIGTEAAGAHAQKGGDVPRLSEALGRILDIAEKTGVKFERP